MIFSHYTDITLCLCCITLFRLLLMPAALRYTLLQDVTLLTLIRRRLIVTRHMFAMPLMLLRAAAIHMIAMIMPMFSRACLPRVTFYASLIYAHARALLAGAAVPFMRQVPINMAAPSDVRYDMPLTRVYLFRYFVFRHCCRLCRLLYFA